MENTNKLLGLEKKLDSLTTDENEKMENERRLNQRIDKINEDFKQCIIEKDNYVRKLDKTNKEIKHLKEANNSFFEENNLLKNEVNNLII